MKGQAWKERPDEPSSFLRWTPNKLGRNWHHKGRNDPHSAVHSSFVMKRKKINQRGTNPNENIGRNEQNGGKSDPEVSCLGCSFLKSYRKPIRKEPNVRRKGESWRRPHCASSMRIKNNKRKHGRNCGANRSCFGASKDKNGRGDSISHLLFISTKVDKDTNTREGAPFGSLSFAPSTHSVLSS